MAAADDSNVIKTAAAKPFFYRDLAVKKLQDNPNSTVVISGLGSAINTAVTVAEMLKANGICVITDVSTSLFPGGKAPKAKINITLTAGPGFGDAVAAKQKDADEKKRIRAEIDAGRERAHAVFKAMTTKA